MRIEESVQYLPPFAQLRVYSAGVWHNVVLSLFGVLALRNMTLLLCLVYAKQPTGFVVLGVSDQWVALRQSFQPGDVISHINGRPCSAQTVQDLWRDTAVQPSALDVDTTRLLIDYVHLALPNASSSQVSSLLHHRHLVRAGRGVCSSLHHMQKSAGLANANGDGVSHACCDVPVLGAPLPPLSSSQSQPQGSCFVDLLPPQDRAQFWCMSAKSAYNYERASFETQRSTSESATGCHQHSDCQLTPRGVEAMQEQRVELQDDRGLCLRPLTRQPDSIIELTVLRPPPGNQRGQAEPHLVLFEGTAPGLFAGLSVDSFLPQTWVTRLLGALRLKWLLFGLVIQIPSALIYCVELMTKVSTSVHVRA